MAESKALPARFADTSPPVSALLRQSVTSSSADRDAQSVSAVRMCIFVQVVMIQLTKNGGSNTMVDQSVTRLKEKGGCALCLSKAELMVSHFFPQSCYKHIRAKKGMHDSPIHLDVKNGDAFYSDMQITSKLLCSTCEQRFSQFGESIVSKVWATSKGFPLREQLVNARVMYSDADFKIFDNDSFSKELVDGLFYFAVSLIWRARVWDRSDARVSDVSLGPYKEKFRKFLLEGCELESVHLLANVNVYRSINGMINMPVPKSLMGRKAFVFELLGITFCLCVGGARTSELTDDINRIGEKVLILNSRGIEMASQKRIHTVREMVVARGRLAKEAVKRK